MAPQLGVWEPRFGTKTHLATNSLVGDRGAMVYVKYFVPEDGDEQSHPNVFKVQGCSSVSALTLGLLKKSFPVEGAYHFRFLTSLPGNKTKVWLDILEDSSSVPTVEGNSEVFAKVSRIGVQHYNPQVPSSSSAPTKPARVTSSASPTSATTDVQTRRDSFGSPGGPVERSNVGTNSRRNSERLINLSDDVISSKSGGTTEEGLLDFGSTEDLDLNTAAVPSATGSHNDLFTLDSATISKVPLSPLPVNSIPGTTMNNPMSGMTYMGRTGNGLQGMSAMQGGGFNAGGGMHGMQQSMMGNGMGMQAQSPRIGGQMQGMSAMAHPTQMHTMQQQQNKNSFSGLDGLSGFNLNNNQHTNQRGGFGR